MEKTLLHGNLHLSILEAHNLPNMDLFHEYIRRCFAPCGLSIPITTTTPKTAPTPDSLRHHHHHPKIMTTDAYVTLTISNATVARTVVVSNDQHPCWNQHFVIPLAHRASQLYFHVKDQDLVGAEFIGTVAIPASSLIDGRLIHEWFPIIDSSGNPPKEGAELLLKMQLIRVDEIPKKLGVENAYFQERSRGVVRLYQDAHMRDGELPEIKDVEGGAGLSMHGKCWKEICEAILGAERLIYIVGWSVYHKVRLVRKEDQVGVGRKDEEGMTLGDLLKYKSQMGVRVLLLLWDDKTSHDKPFFRSVSMLIKPLFWILGVLCSCL